MSLVKDPVCGMEVDTSRAGPTFGLAGSGGLENEPGPERHVRR